MAAIVVGDSFAGANPEPSLTTTPTQSVEGFTEPLRFKSNCLFVGASNFGSGCAQPSQDPSQVVPGPGMPGWRCVQLHDPLQHFPGLPKNPRISRPVSRTSAWPDLFSQLHLDLRELVQGLGVTQHGITRDLEVAMRFFQAPSTLFLNRRIERFVNCVQQGQAVQPNHGLGFPAGVQQKRCQERDQCGRAASWIAGRESRVDLLNPRNVASRSSLWAEALQRNSPRPRRRQRSPH